ncbi:hypothetical protein NN561_014813 [Cricetulus griseus]
MFCGTVRILWYKRVSLQQRYVVPCSMDLLTCCSMDLESRDKDIGALCALWFRAAVHRGTLLQVCFGPVLRFAVYPFYDDPVPWFTVARLLEACLHSLLSFLTSNFPSNPLLPDSLFSIERLSLRLMTRPAGPGDPSSAASFLGGCYPPLCLSLRVHGSALLGPLLTWCCFGGYYPGLSRLPVPFPVVLRFYEPPISTEEQVRPLRVFMRPCRLKSEGRRTPRRPARGPQDAQREDPKTPSARTPRRPARGPHDAQREDPKMPSARTPRGLHDAQREDPRTSIVPPGWIRPACTEEVDALGPDEGPVLGGRQELFCAQEAEQELWEVWLWSLRGSQLRSLELLRECCSGAEFCAPPLSSTFCGGYARALTEKSS